MTELNTRLIQSLYKPHIALTGGYLVSNPNVFNGFEQKFAGVWNIGIVMQVPIWNWGESKYRTRSAKTMTTIANLEVERPAQQDQPPGGAKSLPTEGGNTQTGEVAQEPRSRGGEPALCQPWDSRRG